MKHDPETSVRHASGYDPYRDAEPVYGCCEEPPGALGLLIGLAAALAVIGLVAGIVLVLGLVVPATFRR